MLEVFTEAYAYITNPEARVLAPQSYPNGAGMSIREARQQGLYTGPPVKTSQDVTEHLLINIAVLEKTIASMPLPEVLLTLEEMDSISEAEAKEKIGKSLRNSAFLLSQLELSGQVRGENGDMFKDICEFSKHLIAIRWQN